MTFRNNGGRRFPVAADGDIWRGLATGVLHVCIGLPVLSLIPTMGNRSKQGH